MKIIIIILQAILNLVRKRRDLIANRSKIPANIKNAIKAIYDPKKQGMTNYDVIEAYVEDFTKFIKNGNGTFTQNKYNSSITTQEWLLYKTNGKEIEAMDIYITADDNVSPALRYYYYTSENNDRKIFNLKVGLNHLPASCYKEKGSTIGIVFEAQPASEFNITITQLPTSILKDLSGNGNHAYLYGGKGKLNSGMGLYKVDFTSWRKSSVQTEVKPDVVKVTPNTSDYLFIQYANSVEIPSYKIKVIGLGDNVLKYQYATENGRKEINIVEGENELPTSIKVSNDYQIGYRLTPGTSVFTITQIPDYPDQLCYDGKMYAVCYGFPILTDYTVMAERTWFENRNVFLAKGNIATEAKYAFIFERFKPDGVMAVQSFGAWNDVVSTTDSCISYLTKNKYNGIDIRSGIGADDDMLSIGGALNKGNIELTSVCCHGAIIIADRSFTEEEINWLKDNWEKI